MRPVDSATLRLPAPPTYLGAGFIHTRPSRLMPARGMRPRCRGAIIVLSAFFLIVFMAFVMLAVDTGYILVARTELQRAADSGALAAAAELLDACGETAQNDWSQAQDVRVRLAGRRFVEPNRVTGQNPTVDLNQSQDPEGDILLGEIGDWGNSSSSFRASSSNGYTPSEIRVVRSKRETGTFRSSLVVCSEPMALRSKQKPPQRSSTSFAASARRSVPMVRRTFRFSPLQSRKKAGSRCSPATAKTNGHGTKPLARLKTATMACRRWTSIPSRPGPLETGVRWTSAHTAATLRRCADRSATV